MLKQYFIVLCCVVLVLSCRPRAASQVKDLTNFNNGEPLLDLTEYKITDQKIADEMATKLAKETNEREDFIKSFKSAVESAIAEKTEATSFPPEVYTSELLAIRLYTGSVYGRLNADLRNLPEAPPNAKAGEIVKQDAEKSMTAVPNLTRLIASGINKMPKHRCTVNRGTYLPLAVQKSLENERYYTEKAFVSTSEGYGAGGHHRYVINSEHCPKSIAGVSVAPPEKEVLFSPGSEFEVTRVQKLGHTRRYCVRHIYPSPPGLKPNPILSQIKTSAINAVSATSDSSSSSADDFINIAPPVPRQLEQITWIDLICGKYESQSATENPACKNLPPFVQFMSLGSAMIEVKGNDTTWQMIDIKSASPKVSVKEHLFDIKAVDTLSYKGCLYKEKFQEEKI